MKKVGAISKKGGARIGSGRPAGKTKVKISVSVDEDAWLAALQKWPDKPSRLVNSLLATYLESPCPKTTP